MESSVTTRVILMIIFGSTLGAYGCDDSVPSTTDAAASNLSGDAFIPPAIADAFAVTERQIVHFQGDGGPGNACLNLNCGLASYVWPMAEAEHSLDVRRRFLSGL